MKVDSGINKANTVMAALRVCKYWTFHHLAKIEENYQNYPDVLTALQIECEKAVTQDFISTEPSSKDATYSKLIQMVRKDIILPVNDNLNWQVTEWKFQQLRWVYDYFTTAGVKIREILPYSRTMNRLARENIMNEE